MNITNQLKTNNFDSTKWLFKIEFWDTKKCRKQKYLQHMGKKVSYLRCLLSLYDWVNSIIKADPEHIRIQVIFLKQQNHNMLSKRSFTQDNERFKNKYFASNWETRKTLELDLKYMISSTLKATIGNFSWHFLFFMVAGLWVSTTTLIKHIT